MEDQFWIGFLLGLVVGLLIWLIVMYAGFISVVRSADKKKSEDNRDDWWKKGEPAPWERYWDDE